MTDYSFNAAALTAFCASRECAAEGDELCRWADLVDSIGPSSLPFVIKRSALAEVPFPKLGIQSIDPASLTPKQGEMWVLFCYAEEMRDRFAKDGALRSDGFPLVLEWRKDVQDSPLLSSAFTRMADLVRKQLNVEGWGLWPSFDRYGDKVDFVDPDLFGVESDLSQVASAYGALVTGLFCAIRNRFPPEWTFPTLQWDWERGGTAGVAGIESKITVAADFGARYVSVSAKQIRLARAMHAELIRKAQSDRLRRLKLVPVSDIRSPDRLAATIAFGPSRRRRLVGSLVGVLALLIGFVSVFIWDSTRSFSLYYSAFVDHYGLPQGIHSLSPETAARRTSSFRFDYSGVHWGRERHSVHRNWQLSSWFGLPRRLGRVVHVNSRNVPTPIERDDLEWWPMIMEFDYSSNSGDVEKIICRRRGGKNFVSGQKEKVLTFWPSEGIVNCLVKEECPDGPEPHYAAGEMTRQSLAEEINEFDYCRACRYLLRRDEQGRVCNVTFCDATGVSVADKSGIGGFAYMLSNEGLMLQKACLALGSGQGLSKSCLIPDRYGVALYRYSYQNADLKSVAHFNIQTNLTRGIGSIARCEIDLDDDGNMRGIRSFDENGSPANAMLGDSPSCERRDVVSNGLVVLRTFMSVDANGNKTPNGRSAFTYNDQGDVTRCCWQGADGKPRANMQGNSVEIRECDPYAGLITRLRPCGMDGRTPVFWRMDDGCLACGTDYLYDADGREVEMRRLDCDGNLHRSTDGWAIRRKEYQHGRMVRQSFYDENTNAVLCSSVGSHGVNYKYDRGKLASISRFSLDASGREIPVRDRRGVCEYRWQYDDRGRKTGVAYKDEKGNFCSKRDAGYCREKIIYESLPDGYEYGFSGSRLKGGGELQITRYFGGKNAAMPICSLKGYAELHQVYDSRRDIVYEEYYNHVGEPTTETNSVVFAREVKRDVRGLPLEITCWSCDGQRCSPGLRKSELTGNVHKTVFAYDDFGRLRSKKFFDMTNRPVGLVGTDCCEERSGYDSWGNQCEISFWDRLGGAAIGPNGYHRNIMFFDDRGNCTSVRRYGKKNELLPALGGNLAYVNSEYDGLNRVAKRSYFDTQDCPAVNIRDFNCQEVHYHYKGGSLKVQSVDFISGKSSPCGPLFLPDVSHLSVATDERGHTSATTVLQAGTKPSHGVLSVVSGVVANLPAAKNGICIGDIICAVNGSSVDMFGRCDFGKELQLLRSQEKNLLIARWSPSGYELKQVSFPAKVMGAKFLHGVQISDEKFQQIYGLICNNAKNK